MPWTCGNIKIKTNKRTFLLRSVPITYYRYGRFFMVSSTTAATHNNQRPTLKHTGVIVYSSKQYTQGPRGLLTTGVYPRVFSASHPGINPHLVEFTSTPEVRWGSLTITSRQHHGGQQSARWIWALYAVLVSHVEYYCH